MTLRYAIAVALLAIGLTGCAAIPRNVVVPRQHIVAVSATGEACDPTGNAGCAPGAKYCDGVSPAEAMADPVMEAAPAEKQGRTSSLAGFENLSAEDYRDHLDLMFKSADRQYRDRGGKLRFVVFVHGGLNTQAGALRRAVVHTRWIRAEDPDVYPIFINWRSSLISSYLVEHLFLERQGKRVPRLRPRGVWLAPFYLATDLTRAVVRSPITLFTSWRSDWNTNSWTAQRRETQEQILDLEGLDFGFRPGTVENGRFEVARRTTEYWLTSPFRLVSTPVVDAFGTESWESMNRRRQVGFEMDTEPTIQPLPDGAIAQFVQRLEGFVETHPNVQVTLVGHSMGAMITNEMIRRNPLLPYDEITYMASASTIQDLETTMRHLRAARDADDFPEVHHLMLHQLADLRDSAGRPLKVISPRGSLLVWIDNFLASPNVQSERTSGRSVNLYAWLAAEAEKDHWEKTTRTLSVFEFDAGGRVKQSQPQRHGDFGRLRYWDRTCMDQPLTPGCYLPKRQYRKLTACLFGTGAYRGRDLTDKDCVQALSGP